MPRTKHTNPVDLRRRASKRFRVSESLSLENKNSAEMRRLVQELQVHQIELELQNEELRRARAEVEEGLARYTDLYELAPVGYLTLGRAGEIRRVNLSGARILGQERSRLIGTQLGFLIAADSRAGFQALLSKAFENRTREVCELVVRPAGAAPVNVEITATATPAGSECRVVITDTTERKRAQDLIAIRLQLQEFAATHNLEEILQETLEEVEQLTGGLWGSYHFVEADQRTLARRVSYEQAAASELGEHFSWDEARMCAQCLDQRSTVFDNALVAPSHRSWLANDTSAVCALVVPVFRKERIVAILQMVRRTTPFSADDASAVSYLADVAWEIAERKRAEHEREELQAQLAQAQKMEAIGTLAGGVAHDFNNILAGILGGLSLLELAPLGENPRAVQDMKALVQRGADLTKQLLGFARRGKYDVRPLDIALVVQETSEMFGRTRKDVSIELALASGLRAVLMDRTQLEQVLLNLFVNAGQAMPDGGCLHISADNAELTNEVVAPQVGAATGHFVKLVVADIGGGMDATTQARIFEPFFTTKGPGQGTGLGLASVYGIVNSHAGFIAVESEVGKGTRFTLWLLATDQAVAREKTGAVIRRGVGTILIVDDEAMLTGICARMLKSIGYNALTASRGKEAIEIVRQRAAEISLVILDMIMPEMSGRQTYDALQQIAPGIKVLLSSGFSLEGQAQEILASGCNGFIQKPFDLATLSAKVSEIL
jgi:PAS domain S-box-containing protein